MAVPFGRMMLRPELAVLGVLTAEAGWACWVGGRASADGAYEITAMIACEPGQLGASRFLLSNALVSANCAVADWLAATSVHTHRRFIVCICRCWLFVIRHTSSSGAHAID